MPIPVRLLLVRLVFSAAFLLLVPASGWGQVAKPEFVGDSFSSDLSITVPCSVSVTWVWEGDGFEIALGYVVYRKNGPDKIVLDRQLVFPGESFMMEGAIRVGDRTTLRTATGQARVFVPGDQIGFFFVGDGWEGPPLLTSWDPLTSSTPSGSHEKNGQYGRGCYTSINSINQDAEVGGEPTRQVALIQRVSHPDFVAQKPFMVMGTNDQKHRGDSVTDEDEPVEELSFADHRPYPGACTTKCYPRVTKPIHPALGAGLRLLAEMLRFP